MSVAHRGIVPLSYGLAQHLERALAACDELLTQSADAQNAVRLELTAITHILQARQDAREMRVDDTELRRWVSYFIAQTDALEAAGHSRPKVSRASGEQLLGGRISLSNLTAMLASLLDTVGRQSIADDDHFDDESPGRAPLQSQETAFWATGADGI